MSNKDRRFVPSANTVRHIDHIELYGETILRKARFQLRTFVYDWSGRVIWLTLLTKGGIRECCGLHAHLLRESVVKTGRRPPRLSGLRAGYRCSSASNLLFNSGSSGSSRRL